MTKEEQAAVYQMFHSSLFGNTRTIEILKILESDDPEVQAKIINAKKSLVKHMKDMSSLGESIADLIDQDQNSHSE